MFTTGNLFLYPLLRPCPPNPDAIKDVTLIGFWLARMVQEWDNICEALRVTKQTEGLGSLQIEHGVRLGELGLPFSQVSFQP